jgi:dUTP pyrophosphatase
MTVKVLIAPLTNKIPLPEQAYEGDAGFDVFAANEKIIFLTPGDTCKVPLGFKMALPFGYEAQLRPRSSMAKNGITLPNSPATIDCGYRGEVVVLIQNLSKTDCIITQGAKIAQMVIKECPVTEVVFVNEEELPESERGEGGLGSSGETAVNQ